MTDEEYMQNIKDTVGPEWVKRAAQEAREFIFGHNMDIGDIPETERWLLHIIRDALQANTVETTGSSN